MNINELFDYLKKVYDSLDFKGKLPHTPKGNFIARVMLACKSNDINDIKRVLDKYSNLENEEPELFDVIRKFINDFDVGENK